MSDKKFRLLASFDKKLTITSRNYKERVVATYHMRMKALIQFDKCSFEAATRSKHKEQVINKKMKV
jgi:hypothetical protein